MSPEEIIKNRIIERYKTVRAFTKANDIPYSTVNSLLKRGLAGTGVVTALKICKALDLNIEDVLEEKAPPSTGEKPINEEAAAIGAQLYKILIDAGWIKPGEDITEKQQQFLQSIISLISNEFH